MRNPLSELLLPTGEVMRSFMLKLVGELAVLLALVTEEKTGVIAAVAVVGCKCSD
jgi:hypothetical protein|tara:strand:+ start:241 stop:405 length:165 start_codon:yes stop_codon:yes gene_type:complete